MSALPSSSVEQLFRIFGACWGASKMGSMFPADDQHVVRSVWAAKLGQFSKETLAAATESVIAANREWPPSLGEFAEACRQAAQARAQHASAPRLDIPRTGDALARRNLQRVHEALATVRPSAGRAWARRVLERAEREPVPAAVLQMARGAA